MNQANARLVAERAEGPLSPCCIATVRNLLDRVSARHRQEPLNPRRADRSDNVELDLPLPSLHDDYGGEVEAALLPGADLATPSTEIAIRYDDPTELARARRVFALSWLVPLLLVAATLALLGETLAQGMYSLLQFSMLVMGVPLIGSLAALFLRTVSGRQKHLFATALAKPSSKGKT